MRIPYQLFFYLSLLCLTACSKVKPLANVHYDEKPFVQLKSTHNYDTVKANAEVVNSQGLDNSSIKNYGGLSNVFNYGNGQARYGNFKNRFYPLVSTGKLDVYQEISVTVTKQGMNSASVSETKLKYYFNKAGSTEIKKANYANLKPIMMSNSSYKSQLASFNIVNKVTTVTEGAGFLATVGGLYMVISAVSKNADNANNIKAGPGAAVAVLGFGTYVVSHLIHLKNMRKIPSLLLRYNKDRSSNRR